MPENLITTSGESPNTILIAPAAGHVPWHYRDYKASLERMGYNVITPHMPNEDPYARYDDYRAKLSESAEGSKVVAVVAHSKGGRYMDAVEAPVYIRYAGSYPNYAGKLVLNTLSGINFLRTTRPYRSALYIVEGTADIYDIDKEAARTLYCNGMEKSVSDEYLARLTPDRKHLAPPGQIDPAEGAKYSFIMGDDAVTHPMWSHLMARMLPETVVRLKGGHCQHAVTPDYMAEETHKVIAKHVPVQTLAQ